MKEKLICLLTSVGALLLACGLVACGGVTPNAQGSVVITPNTSLPIEEPSDGSQMHSCNFEAEVVSPTCTERGYTVYTCECGETYIDDYAQPLDHLFTNYVSDNNATCTKDGTKTAECDRVGCRETDTITDYTSGHSFTNYVSDNNATCTQDGTKTAVCDRTNCEETDTIADVDSAKGHSFTNYVSDDNATCTQDGTKTAVCDREGCGETDTKSEENSMVEHTYSEMWSYDDSYHWHNATCGCDLETDYGEHTYGSDGNCSVCAQAQGLVYTISNGEATLTDYTGSASDIVIPDTYNDVPVTKIGNSAFYNCSSMTSVVIPDSITVIDAYAFKDCESLTSVIIGDSVTKFGQEAFSNCSLTNFVIPDSVTELGHQMFKNCESLSNVVIGAGVEYCGNSGEGGGNLNFLESWNDRDAIFVWGSDAFYECYSLTKIEVSENNKYFCDIDGVLYTKDKTILLHYPSGRVTQSFVVPDCVTGIAAKAFYGCSVENVNTNNVTVIGHLAFMYSNDVGLENVEMPNVIKILGDAFYGCADLSRVVIGENLTKIGCGAFFYCNSLGVIEFEGTVAQWKAIEIEEDYWGYQGQLIKVICSDGEWSVIF